MQYAAPHRATRMSHGDDISAKKKLTPMTEIPGFHCDVLWWDLMHVAWLGFARDVAASVLATHWDQRILNRHNC
eukprot:5273435-Prorocentrum_lima.AAC.1